jgi:NADH-quinone oxidoreductase subunit G
MINIEIDGKKLEVKPGSMVIAAADDAGIYIPRFCYHKKLSVAANCRMCLVEVEKSGKPLPACATPVMEGMKVFTRSKIALDAQKSVMEFLLINHPLDCPICDQGGACELQDLSLGFGSDGSRYTEEKRTVKDKDIGSLINTNMTRCIQCTRCIRFGREVAGLPELGATGRGENMEVGTYIEHSLVSEVSGNVIDLCPVGALLSKPFQFSARAWELDQYASVSPHDCLGSNLHIHTRRNVVMRVAPKDNEELNETWISDRDRFSYEGLKSVDRLQIPMIKKEGQWQETDWQTALNVAVHGLQDAMSAHGGNDIGALVSPNATLEEMYLLQKLWHGIGSSNLDHRLRQTDFSDQDHAPLYPTLGVAIQDLEKQNAILLVGSNIRHEQPIAGLRIRKATLSGGQVSCLNVLDYDFHFPLANKLIVHPDEMVSHLAGIAKALGADLNVTAGSVEQAIAQQLKSSEHSVVLLGALAEQHPQAAALRTLAHMIAELSQSKCGRLTEGANTAGAWLAGVIPHRQAIGKAGTKIGLDVQAMLEKGLKAYLLLGVEPEFDFANSVKVEKALEKANFVVGLSPFKSAGMLKNADVILPIAPFSETSGTFVNVEGQWQSFNGVVPPLGEVRPGWKVLRVLGNLFDIAGFDYVSSEEVREECKKTCGSLNIGLHPAKLVEDTLIHPSTLNNNALASAPFAHSNFSIVHSVKTFISSFFSDKAPVFNEAHIKVAEKTKLTRIGAWPMYRVDNLVRRSQPLQDSAAAELPKLYVNTAVAQKLGLLDGGNVTVTQEGTAELLVKFDERIPDACVYIPSGFSETAALGAAFGHVEVKA